MVERIERTPTLEEKRWFASSIRRVAEIALRKRGEESTSGNIKAFVQATWKPISLHKGKLLRDLAVRIQLQDITEASKRYLDSGRSSKSISRRAQLDILGKFENFDDGSLDILGDIIFPEKRG